MHPKLLCAVLVTALFAAGGFAQTLPPGVQKNVSLGGITEYQYPNGLRVLLYPDASNPKITVNVTYLVGSRHEGYGETGMAHLLEHLDFIETTNGRDIKREITEDQRGIPQARRSGRAHDRQGGRLEIGWGIPVV